MCTLGRLSAAGPVVPKQLTFCGVQLTLDAYAQKYVQGVVDQLHRNPSYFNKLVDRTDTYLPFVEEAFRLVGVPDDLKFIVLQESSLIGDAVSSSNAVGFWQFKSETAKEVGLTVNTQVDERMHIFRSSIGAARYFYQINRQFDNWIYAIIGYNRGPTGALPFTQSSNYGKRRMTLTEKTHWYALKAVAYKLAFQDHVGLAEQPETWLEPIPVEGGIKVNSLLEALDADETLFREYNLWIRKNTLPDGYFYTCYVPQRQAAPPDTMVLEPHIAVIEEEIKKAAPEDPIPTPKVGPQPWPTRRGNKFIVRDFRRDTHYGDEFVVTLSGQSLTDVSHKTGISTQKLESWNPDATDNMDAGTVILIKPPNRAKFHVVKKGETLRKIAAMHGIHEKKLRKRNRMEKGENTVYAGQKFYLRKKKPKKQRIILLEMPFPAPKPKLRPPPPEKVVDSFESEDSEEEVEDVPPPSPPIIDKIESASEDSDTLRLPKIKSEWVTHTVAKGETLWSISRRYGTTVGVIQQANGLRNNDIDVGQKLKVMRVSNAER